jgi:nucleotide-binding universal stress UspA family protein
MQERLPIKVAVDGTPANDAAIRFAALRARRLDRPLVLVHVIPAWGVPTTHAPHEFERLGHRALRRAETLARDVFPLDRISAELRTGQVIPTLVAASADAYELILGSDNPLTQFMGGGVIVGVASAASNPLIVVPTAWREQAGGPRLVVVALDEIRDTVLRTAFVVARDQDARLEFVHVHRLPEHYAQLFRSLPEFAAWQWNAEQEIQKAVLGVSADFPDVDYGISVDWGAPAEILRARSEEASLLILDHDPHRWRQIGRTGRTLMQSSHCPVRVVSTSPLVEQARQADELALASQQS